MPVSIKCTKNGFQVTKQEMPSALWTGSWVGFEVGCLLEEQDLLFAPVGHKHYYFSKNIFNVQTCEKCWKLHEILVWKHGIMQAHEFV